MEQVLGVDIRLADAGAGDRMPDGIWTYPQDRERRGIVEITSPPAKKLLHKWAAAKRGGKPQQEHSSIPLRWGELAQVCSEMLAEKWARENLHKLRTQPADERHLFLFARSYKEGGDYFCRLSDSYEDGSHEQVGDLVLPDGISDVWFRGRGRRNSNQLFGAIEIWLARFHTGSGWHRYVVTMYEQNLPSPTKSLAEDNAPAGWRQPKDRSAPPAAE